VYTYHFYSASSASPVVTVLNGTSASSPRLTRAQVRLNNNVVADWDDINTSMSWLGEGVTVQSGWNSLEIENDSSARSVFTVLIYGVSIVPA
jgi:hypothetical protein